MPAKTVKPIVSVIERFADKGEHSHWEVIDQRTGKTLWSELRSQTQQATVNYPIKPIETCVCGVPLDTHHPTACGWEMSLLTIFPWEKIYTSITVEEKKERYYKIKEFFSSFQKVESELELSIKNRLRLQNQVKAEMDECGAQGLLRQNDQMPSWPSYKVACERENRAIEVLHLEVKKETENA